MALTQFEKDCIADIVAPMTNQSHSPTDAHKAAFAIAIEGTEAERQAIIVAYINDEGLAMVAKQITGCDDQIAYVTALKTTLQTKEAEMLAYVTA
jgi:hypothetical protein